MTLQNKIDFALVIAVSHANPNGDLSLIHICMRNAECIVAVNKAADAPIFDIAHFGVVDDYRNFIPALIEELKAQDQ